MVHSRRFESVEGFNTVWSNTNEEKVRDRRDSAKNDESGLRGRGIRAFRVFRSSVRATGSAHGDRQERRSPKGFEKTQNLQEQYGIRRFFEGYSKKVSASMGRFDRSIMRNWTVHAPWTVSCRVHSDRSSPKFLK
jgi:hypothetical protein